MGSASCSLDIDINPDQTLTSVPVLIKHPIPSSGVVLRRIGPEPATHGDNPPNAGSTSESLSVISLRRITESPVQEPIQAHV